MGYTHFDKVDGVNGLFTGAKGSEQKIAAAGILYTGTAGSEVKVADNGVLYKGTSGSEVAITGSEGLITLVYDSAGGVGQTVPYFTAPYNASLAGYVNFSVSAGTGRQVTVTTLSGGAVGTTAVIAANGTVGVPVAMTFSADLTAGSGYLVAMTSCATAQTGVTVNLILTKT